MIKILYDCADFAVCVKPVGVCSQNDSSEDMVKLLRKQLDSDIFPVHRLDTAVGGTMVFAKTRTAAAKLSKQISDKIFQKEYLAVLSGTPSKEHDILEDLLFKDSSKNKSYVVKRERKGVKKASLEYNLIGSENSLSLVKILLHTGRTHQIRVQFSSRHMPLVGDGKYGSKDNHCSIALWSYSVSFFIGEERFFFSSIPDFSEYPWSFFSNYDI